MQGLIQQISAVRKTEIRKLVGERLRQFSELHKQGNAEWFSELCFCILTANSTAKKGIQIQNALGTKGFLQLPERQLAKKLKLLGHRFYNKRAEFIAKARAYKNIKDKILSFKSEFEARDWLAQTVLGIGYKEASHFLRNVGFRNLAILDRHILSLMHEHRMLAEKPKSLNRQRYLDAEQKLSRLAIAARLSQAELDLFLWFLKTGKVLK